MAYLVLVQLFDPFSSLPPPTPLPPHLPPCTTPTCVYVATQTLAPRKDGTVTGLALTTHTLP